jgi:hypothetical protein
VGRRGVATATATSTEEYMRRNYANNVSEYNTVIGSLVQQRRHVVSGSCTPPVRRTS